MSTVTTTRQRTNNVAKTAATVAHEEFNQAGLPVRVPTTPPPFTIGDIRKAIPAHCFKKSYVMSFGYLAVDLVMVAVLYYASTFIPTVISNERFGATAAPLLRHLAWTAYWCCQGVVMTGLWVIGHECGHGGFAESTLVGDITGFVVHTALLVPYFSWKISHRKHHSNTGSLQWDEVFCPEVDMTKVDQGYDHDADGSAKSVIEAVTRIFNIFIMLTLGWPLYLMMNATGHKSYSGVINHFYPKAELFSRGSGHPQDVHNERLVILSDLGLIVAFAVIGYFSYHYTFLHVVYVYGIPYLITNLFLVLITFLQHTDLSLPHYAEGEWDWLRGALATVDRSYGILDIFFHHIADTHVCHHLFSFLPHYHAQEASEHMKKVIGQYYRADRTPVPQALWKVYGTCQKVHPDATNPKVMWF